MKKYILIILCCLSPFASANSDSEKAPYYELCRTMMDFADNVMSRRQRDLSLSDALDINEKNKSDDEDINNLIRAITVDAYTEPIGIPSL